MCACSKRWSAVFILLCLFHPLSALAADNTQVSKTHDVPLVGRTLDALSIGLSATTRLLVDSANGKQQTQQVTSHSGTIDIHSDETAEPGRYSITQRRGTNGELEFGLRGIAEHLGHWVKMRFEGQRHALRGIQLSLFALQGLQSAPRAIRMPGKAGYQLLDGDPLVAKLRVGHIAGENKPKDLVVEIVNEQGKTPAIFNLTKGHIQKQHRDLTRASHLIGAHEALALIHTTRVFSDLCQLGGLIDGNLGQVLTLLSTTQISRERPGVMDGEQGVGHRSPVRRRRNPVTVYKKNQGPKVIFKRSRSSLIPAR